jgi:carbonic anhydrase
MGLIRFFQKPWSSTGGAQVSATDELIANNAQYVAAFDKGSLPLPPGKRVAVLACMDARLDPAKALGLSEGDAHVIRNAGGVASEDALRSLVISQRLLGTEEIILIHHTDCGMETFTDEEVKDQILKDTGLRPSFSLEAFPKAEEDVRQTSARIKANPFVPKKTIRGFVYEVKSGQLREVDLD